MKSILDKSFKYTNAASTDIRKTFARVRREQQQQRDLEEREKKLNRVIHIKRTT
jgi:hypothetical protein